MDDLVEREKMHEIQFLYSSDCPSYMPALALLHEVLSEEQLELAVTMVLVDSEPEAQRTRFPGSPTIRVGGRDIEAAAVPPVGLTCRTYRSQDGTTSPIPSKDTIRRGLRLAMVASEPQV